MSLGELAFRTGRKIGKHPLAGRIFCLTERLLPVPRIVRADGVVAFHHPRPIATPHILVVPTQPFPALISPHHSHQERAGMLWNMVKTARQVSASMPDIDAWTMVINGGTRQEIGQMHGHVLAETMKAEDSGRLVSDLQTTPDVWNTLFAKLEIEAAIPHNGYSLVFRWDREPLNTLSWAINRVNV